MGYEPSEAESAEARVLELATGEDSEIGLAERCPTVQEVSREVMENLDESAGDEDENEVGSLPDESDVSRQQTEKGFSRSDWSFEERAKPSGSGSLDGKDGSWNDSGRIFAAHRSAGCTI